MWVSAAYTRTTPIFNQEGEFAPYHPVYVLLKHLFKLLCGRLMRRAPWAGCSDPSNPSPWRPDGSSQTPCPLPPLPPPPQLLHAKELPGSMLRLFYLGSQLRGGWGPSRLGEGGRQWVNIVAGCPAPRMRWWDNGDGEDYGGLP